IYASPQNNLCPQENEITIRNSFSKYENSWYFIDAIATNRVSLVTDSMHVCYAFTDSVNLNDINTDDILSNPNSFLVVSLFCRKSEKNEILDSHNKFLQQAFDTEVGIDAGRITYAKKQSLKNGLNKFRLSPNPSYFIYFLVQGKEIKFISVYDFIWLPSNLLELDNEAFYKVLIPVWYPEPVRGILGKETIQSKNK
ncbi:MAG: hypothetical protein K2O88_00080, partial [Paramuribaculum sp.]|nr:hypothetical protein [Paramuribaculum sp.]